jgi:hypothetical protein
MKRRIQITLAILSVAIFGGLAWRFLHAHAPPDPTFRGKALSQWFYESPPGSAYLTPGALEAVRQLGTSATPYLLQEVSAWDSGPKQVLVQSLQHMPRVGFTSMYARQYRARQGLAALGFTGAFALTQGLTNGDPQIRRGCALALAFPEFSAYSSECIPCLRCALKDRSPRVRAQVAATLTTIITNPVVAVPLFSDLLDDPDRWVQVTAADGLGRYGAQAKASVPALSKALSSTDPLIRTHVADALKAIDPRTAAKAGAK